MMTISCHSDTELESSVLCALLRTLQALTAELQRHNCVLVGMGTVSLEEHLAREEELIRELSLQSEAVRGTLRGRLPDIVELAIRNLLSVVRTHEALLRKSCILSRALVNTIASCERDRISYGIRKG